MSETKEELRERLRKAERVIAWFHDRVRTVWGESSDYVNSPMYEEVIFLLRTVNHEETREHAESPADPEPGRVPPE